MPSDGILQTTHDEILSFDEIITVCKSAANLGIKKIKVTGGEPLVRLGVPTLIKEIKGIPGIENVTLTTNGVLLGDRIRELLEAGIDGINISLDSIDSMEFKRITGFDLLPKVLLGIEKVLEHGSIPLKVNCVPMRKTTINKTCISGGFSPTTDVWLTLSRDLGALIPPPAEVGELEHVSHQVKVEDGLDDTGSIPTNQNQCQGDFLDIVSLAKEAPIHVRFIEVMPIGYGKDFEYISEKEIINEIENKYGKITPYSKKLGNGPSHYYQIEGFQGKIGFISAISHKFCDSCNRVRLTSQGYLKTCLQYELGGDLKETLRKGASVEEMTKLMRAIIMRKPEGHVFKEQDFVNQEENQLIMSKIGG
jgi:cyclic pyranopterin phosphate synthase